MAHQSLVAKLDGALSATHAADANITILPRGLGSRAPLLIKEGIHQLEPALPCLGHHGSAKASSFYSFLQDSGKTQGMRWTINKSPQKSTLAFCEVHAKSSNQATAFMFTQGQQQPMMGQYPQQPMGQPQQPMMGQQPQQPMVGQQQPAMNQQQPIMGQQPMGQPNYQQPMVQQQPSGQNYGGPSSQGNDRFGNSGGGYNNSNNGGGASNGNNGGDNIGNSSNNNNSGGSSSKKGTGGALAAGILLPVIFAALGGVVAYMVFCRGGNEIRVNDPDDPEPEPSSASSSEEDDPDDTGS